MRRQTNRVWHPSTIGHDLAAFKARERRTAKACLRESGDSLLRLWDVYGQPVYIARSDYLSNRRMVPMRDRFGARAERMEKAGYILVGVEDFICRENIAEGPCSPCPLFGEEKRSPSPGSIRRWVREVARLSY